MDIALFVAALISGLIGLTYAADKFVFGAAASANILGVSTLIIGIIVIGLGTSAPEMFVSSLAALQGNTGLAIGNAIGSNIANIALILGITALLGVITIESRILKRELPLLMAVMALATLLLFDLHLSRLDGIILIVTLLIVLGWLVFDASRNKRDDTLAHDLDDDMQTNTSMKAATLWLFAGLIGLMISSQLLIYGAVGIAKIFGVSDLVIGLTIVAIGTSLPELAAAIASVKKGEHNLAVGNVIGSNIFNTLGVIGLAGFIYPTTYSSVVLERDILVNIALTFVMFLFAWGVFKRRTIQKIEGFMLVSAFIGYQCLVYITAGY